jgi:hypothetical protein
LGGVGGGGGGGGAVVGLEGEGGAGVRRYGMLSVGGGRHLIVWASPVLLGRRGCYLDDGFKINNRPHQIAVFGSNSNRRNENFVA